MRDFYGITLSGGRVRAEVAMFGKSPSARECHLMVHVEDKNCSYIEQICLLVSALREARAYLNGFSCVFLRYFLSDAANQAEFLYSQHAQLEWECTYSVIQQPPLDGSKVAAWVYLVSDMEVAETDGVVCAEHNGYVHYWRSSGELHEGDSFAQAEYLLNEEDKFLKKQGMTMLNDCIRTWFYLQNIDVNYQGMVLARNKNFAENGLTKDTHFITSTGIGGRMGSPESIVRLDSYSVKGLQPEQNKFLYAKSHLNPTYEYNVAFERGTQVIYGDRKHLLLSGTASIDNKGQIVHPGDIRKQTERMLANCEALLNEGGGTLDDLGHLLIYLRDVADYGAVREIFESRLPQTPKVILLAPVCRPGWLIEVEGMAVVKNSDARFRPF